MKEYRQPLNATQVFSSKAEKYAKYRWGYEPAAISKIFEITGISSESLVADIGAGTGILTREFPGKIKAIFAVEPNPEMREILTRELGSFPTCHIVDGAAEATTLPYHSMDLVTVAQAAHWFDPIPTRLEFHRILKPGGWLAICRNYGTDYELHKALLEIYPTELDTNELMIGKDIPRSFYFCDDNYIKLEFPHNHHVNWEDFFGGLISASYAPDEDSEHFPVFKQGARGVFEKFSSNEVIEQHHVTELYLGQINCQEISNTGS